MNPALPPKGRIYRLVLRLLQPYRRWLLLVFLAMSLEAFMGLLAPWPLKIIIDHAIGGAPLPAALAFLNGSFITASPSALTVASAIALVVFGILGAGAGYMNAYYTESIAQNVASDLRRKLYHHLQRLSLSYYATHETAKIINTITTDVSTVQEFASQSILRIIVDLMTIAGMLAIMFYLHWDFALIAVALTPVLLFLLVRFRRQVKKATREVRRDQGIMAAVMQQGLESMRSVNAFGRHDLEEERLRKASIETVQAALKARRLKAILPAVVAVCVALCVSLILWRGTGLVMQQAMTVGALTVFLAYLSKFFTPAQDMAKMTNIIAQTGVALERIQVILDADNIIPEKKDGFVPAKLSGDIYFDNVSFGYSPGHPVLNGFNMQISSGQRIGICGPSGCGKSTVASLIARFYDPAGGRILIDGIDVADYKLEALRQQIGFVLQDTFIFYGTVAENIAYGRPGATEEEIMHAARLARAHHFISAMPQGYNTIVGERGITLSGGQRQCIGIARALVRNSPILILDEPTASLDAAAETTVMNALEHLKEDRTVITIAHRLSTLRDADKIIVLHNGMVAEEGRHAELIRQDSLYAELFFLQSGIRKSPKEMEMFT